MRITGSYTVTTTLGEPVRAFVPRPLPPADPPLPSSDFFDLNRQAELALARLAGVSGLVPSVEWLLYSAIRKEALLTSQIEGTQATLTDLFDEEALAMYKSGELMEKLETVTFCASAEESRALNSQPGPCLIMAGKYDPLRLPGYAEPPILLAAFEYVQYGAWCSGSFTAWLQKRGLLAINAAHADRPHEAPKVAG